jgi:hypothetical protein
MVDKKEGKKDGKKNDKEAAGGVVDDKKEAAGGSGVVDDKKIGDSKVVNLQKHYDVVIISYKFANKAVHGGSLGQKIKEYYEDNSRGMVTYTMTNFTATIPTPFGKTNLNKATAMGKSQADAHFGANKFDLYVHFCNPTISHTGRNQSMVYASYPNAIHEFGHLMKFSHANSFKYGSNGNITTVHTKDPFDCMTIFAPYPSLNPVHRHSHGWYLPGELVEMTLGNTYKMAMLKNLSDKTNIKALHFVSSVNHRNYWITFGTFKNKPVIAFHTSSPDFATSYLDEFYSIVDGKVINHRSGISVTIADINNNFMTIKVTATQELSALSAPEPDDDPDPVISENNDDCVVCDCKDDTVNDDEPEDPDTDNTTGNQ